MFHLVLHKCPLEGKKEKVESTLYLSSKKQNDVFFLVGMFEAEQSVVLYLCYSQFVMIYNLYIFNDEVLMQVSEIKCVIKSFKRGDKYIENLDTNTCPLPIPRFCLLQTLFYCPPLCCFIFFFSFDFYLLFCPFAFVADTFVLTQQVSWSGSGACSWTHSQGCRTWTRVKKN